MAGFLLLPEDETLLLAHLRAEGLARLAHDDLTFGPPVTRAAAPALEALAELVFWAPGLGPLEGTALDRAHAPILVWTRSAWQPDGALAPGRLRTQARPRKDQPPALLALHDEVERWMKRSGEHVGRRLWAFPRAARWVREGGSIAERRSAD